MALINDIPKILDESKKYSGTFIHNKELFNIYEGDLLTYVLKDLEKSLSKKSFESIVPRVAPINILKRMVDKLSRIYHKPPMRNLNDNERDKEVFSFYEKELNPNNVFQIGNNFFNLFKNTLIEPYIYKGKPRARVIPSDRFFVYSDNKVEPNCPTHILKYMGETMVNGEKKNIIYAYTDTEFLIIDDSGNVMMDLMIEAGNPEGINPYGKLPFVYINRSLHRIIPTIDTDTLKMTKLIPVILSDLNYAVMYQSFSVVWGIDVNFENIELSPNAFWSLKSDNTTDKQPQIGTIKPQVDIQQVLNFINAQIAIFFQTKNIKPGAIDKLTIDNAASGIAKAIDEMDTAEDRTTQTKYFTEAEEQFWDLIINYMHPVWINTPDYQMRLAFSPEADVTVQFPEQRPIVNETEVTDNAIKKHQGGYITKEMAIQEMYPDKTKDEIEQIMEATATQNVVEVPEIEEENAEQQLQ